MKHIYAFKMNNQMIYKWKKSSQIIIHGCSFVLKTEMFTNFYIWQ